MLDCHHRNYTGKTMSDCLDYSPLPAAKSLRQTWRVFHAVEAKLPSEEVTASTWKAQRQRQGPRKVLPELSRDSNAVLGVIKPLMLEDLLETK